MPLSDIPVVADEGPLSGQGRALLGEVAALLEHLLASGAGGIVDIRGLPMTPADRLWLLGQLGRGEVEILLDINGRSRIAETAFSGVWWVEHRDDQGRLISEFIEVAFVPELLAAHPDDVAAARDGLRRRLTEN